MSDSFGNTDPRRMPSHLFHGALFINHQTAVRADISRQNFSVCPRCWYIDAAFRCDRCDQTFVFTAAEQRHWYEDLGFWVDSQPKQCAPCRKAVRELKLLRQEYDREIAAVTERRTDPTKKARMIEVIEVLTAAGVALRPNAVEVCEVLRRQLTERIQDASDTGS